MKKSAILFVLLFCVTLAGCNQPNQPQGGEPPAPQETPGSISTPPSDEHIDTPPAEGEQTATLYAEVLRAFTGAGIPIPRSGRWANAGMVRGQGVELCWRLLDAQYWAKPRLARRQRIFLVADFGGRRAHEILFKPRSMLQVSPAGREGGVPAAQIHRGPVIETGGRVPIVRPFQLFRMRGAANDRYHVQFQDSFGFMNDPFPTLLAGAAYPFAFYFADDPGGGCVRFPTELESERLIKILLTTSSRNLKMPVRMWK